MREFYFIPKYWEWTEDVLFHFDKALTSASIADAVHASLFTYDCNKNVMRAFCEAWCPDTNTFLACLVGWNHGSFLFVFLRSSCFLCLVERTNKCERMKGELVRNHHSLFLVKNHGSLPIPYTKIIKMTKLSLNKSKNYKSLNI